MRNESSSNPTLINCTFCANIAICDDVKGSSKMGAGMSNQESDPIIINSIFWDSDTSEIYSEANSDITIRNCVIKDMWVVNKDDDGCSTTSSDITSADPYFGPFAENGGPVQTIQISAGGSACRAGLAPGTAITSGEILLATVPSADARGVSRDIGVSADIGAYAWQYGSGKVTVLAASKDLEIGQTTTVTGNSEVTPLSSDTDAKAWRAVTLTAVSPDVAALSSDNKTITALSRGTAKFNAIVRGNAFTIPSPALSIKVSAKSKPLAEVTDNTRTDTLITDASKASGIIVIENKTDEDFAIFDGFKELADANNGSLPGGITVSSLDAIEAKGAQIDTSHDIYTSADVKQSIANYWKLGAASEDKVRIVEVKNTVGSTTAETLWAKFWRLLTSFFGADKSDHDNSYLPLQTNFTITSADIAALPEYVTTGLTAENLLSSVDLFVIVSGDGKAQARSLHDVAGGNKGKFITVSGDNDRGYTISTRVLLFNMGGTVSKDMTPGAKWVQKFFAKSSDKTTNRDSNNYFIVQDGAKDETYDLCMAFAAKETNYAAVTLMTSDDIESKDTGYVKWTISGDAHQQKANASADIRGGEQAVTLAAVPNGYTVVLSDASQTLSEDVMTIASDVTWGGAWNITATFKKIETTGLSLDKSYAAAAVGGAIKLSAIFTPANAYDQSVEWTTSDASVAEVAEYGTVTGKAQGEAVITATAKNGSGLSAACRVSVKQNAAEEETPDVTPTDAPTVTTPAEAVPNGDVVAVTPGYIT